MRIIDIIILLRVSTNRVRLNSRYLFPVTLYRRLSLKMILLMIGIKISIAIVNKRIMIVLILSRGIVLLPGKIALYNISIPSVIILSRRSLPCWIVHILLMINLHSNSLLMTSFQWSCRLPTFSHILPISTFLPSFHLLFLLFCTIKYKAVKKNYFFVVSLMYWLERHLTMNFWSYGGNRVKSIGWSGVDAVLGATYLLDEPYREWVLWLRAITFW